VFGLHQSLTAPNAAAQFVLIFDQVNNQLGFADADSSLCPATNAVDGAQGPSEAFAPTTALAPLTVRNQLLPECHPSRRNHRCMCQAPRLLTPCTFNSRTQIVTSPDNLMSLRRVCGCIRRLTCPWYRGSAFARQACQRK